MLGQERKDGAVPMEIDRLQVKGKGPKGQRQGQGPGTEGQRKRRSERRLSQEKGSERSREVKKPRIRKKSTRVPERESSSTDRRRAGRRIANAPSSCQSVWGEELSAIHSRPSITMDGKQGVFRQGER